MKLILGSNFSPRHWMGMLAIAALCCVHPAGVRGAHADQSDADLIEIMSTLSIEEIEILASLLEPALVLVKKRKISDLVWGHGVGKTESAALTRAKDEANDKCKAKGKQFAPLNAPNGVPPNEACGPTNGGFKCSVVGTCVAKPATEGKKDEPKSSGGGEPI